MALQNKDKEIAKFLIKKGADPNTTSTIEIKFEVKNFGEVFTGSRSAELTVLMMAIQNGDKEIVQLLLDKGADPNIKTSEGTALIFARDKEIIQLLLDKGADPNTKDGGRSPLMLARDKEIAQLLIEKGADPNLQGQMGTTLMYVLFVKNNPVAQLLLENGVDPNTETKNGTALIKAAHAGNAEGVQLLIDWGVEIKSESESVKFAFTQAVSHGHIEVVKIFLKYGMDPNYTDSSDITPLMTTTQHDYNPKLAMILIQNKADPNIQGLGGNTVLMMAAINNSKNVAQILLDNGADPNIINDEGKTALEIAKDNGNKEIVKMIELKNSSKDFNNNNL